MPLTGPGRPGQHPTVAAAQALARHWCAGQRIGEQPAFEHAAEVAQVLCGHLPAAAPDVVAAVLLHDSPDLAPPGIDLDTTLATLVSRETARLVRALQHEHDDLDIHTVPTPPSHDLALMQASAADKIVSIRAVLDRADTASDPGTYWTQRHGFIAALPYFRAFHRAAQRALPLSMAAELGGLIARAELRVRPTPSTP
jgi:hypothetical protein